MSLLETDPLSPELLEKVGAVRRPDYSEDWLLRCPAYETLKKYFMIRITHTVQMWVCTWDGKDSVIKGSSGFFWGEMTNQEFLSFYAGLYKS